MIKKGTGWIPDYPDVRDFTLDNSEIQNLSNKVQTQGSNADVESLADTLRQALKFIAQHQEKITAQQQENITAQQQNKNEDDTKNINTLIEQLSSEISFVNVEMNNVLKQKMSDSEVLLVKNYLQRIISTWKVFRADENFTYEPVISDTTLDPQTCEAVRQVLKPQPYLLKQYCSQEHDGSIGKYDMDALKILASGADITRDIENEFMKLIAANAEEYKKIIIGCQKKCPPKSCEKYIFNKYLLPFLKNPDKNDFLQKTEKNNSNEENIKIVQHYQGVLALYLHIILKNFKSIKSEIEKIKNEKLGCILEQIAEAEELNSILERMAEKLELIENLDLIRQQLEEKLNSFIPQQIKNKEVMPSIRKIIEWIAEILIIILAIKDNKGFQSLMDNFEEGLKSIGFSDYELREFKNIKIKDYKGIIDYLGIKSIKKCDIKPDTIITNITNIIEPSIRKLNYLMGLLYTVCPPIIPESLFQKTEIPISTPIPEIEVKLFINKLYGRLKIEKESKDIKQLVKSLKENNSHPNLQSLNEILIQILMPLGQYNNLSKAVEAGIVKIWSFLSEETDNNENIKKIIQETMREYNVTVVQDYSVSDGEIDWQGWDSKKFQEKIDSISKEIESILESSKEHLSPEIKKLQAYNPTTPNNSLNNKPLKKPLFQISASQLSLLLEGGGFQEKKADKTSKKSLEKLNNSLLFPISSNLRQQIKTEIEKAKIDKTIKKLINEQGVFLRLPEFVDLSYWCSPIEDQGALNSCTAYAGIALIEYAQKKSSGSYTDASPLFLYQVTRNLMQREGDSGASVRDTMKAMVAFGVCPEEYWPYNEDKFNEEPTSFCYSFAENYKTIKYFRLDYGQISKYALLSQVKLLLVAEIPCIFGFTLYNSVYDEVNFSRGHIPLPSQRDKVIGGHTVVAVGYHDRKIIENEDGERFEGALLIRNSWGNLWGQGGYGWMPYDYIIKGLTADWWSLLKAEWLANGNFGAGASAWNADKGDKNGDGGVGQTPP